MNKILFKAIGADPEVFLVDAKGNPYSAEGLFGGSKYEPKPMARLPEGFFIQEDNVAAEFNIPPASTPAEFAKNIIRGMGYIEKVAKINHLQVKLESALHFPVEQLNTQHAQTLGCEPDFNIWTMSINATPIPPKTLRTAAGHLHISWQEPDNIQVKSLVRSLDLTLGVPSILATNKNERRSLYGQAGAFRPKPYGVEYRTLDNFWLQSAEHCKWIFTTVLNTIEHLNVQHQWFMDSLEERELDIRKCINEYDKDLALELIDDFNLEPMPILL